MQRRVLSAVFVAIGLAGAIHADWHFARPTHHRLSLGLPWHWLLAIPVFTLVAWYVTRVWPMQVRRASIAIVLSAAFAAGVLEPAWEYFMDGANLEWAFGATRNAALAAFVGTGLIAYVLTLASIQRVSQSSRLGRSH